MGKMTGLKKENWRERYDIDELLVVTDLAVYRGSIFDDFFS